MNLPLMYEATRWLLADLISSMMMMLEREVRGSNGTDAMMMQWLEKVRGSNFQMSEWHVTVTSRMCGLTGKC